MKEEVLNTLSEKQKELLECNRWAIWYLAEIEEVFINNMLQELGSKFMVKYIDALLEKRCIDEEDYFFLEHLIEIVEKSRIDYFMEMDNLERDRNDNFPWLADQARRKRAYMRDYRMKDDEAIYIEEYKDNFMKHNEIIPKEAYQLCFLKNSVISRGEYNKKLKKVYDKVMRF